MTACDNCSFVARPTSLHEIERQSGPSRPAARPQQANQPGRRANRGPGWANLEVLCRWPWVLGRTAQAPARRAVALDQHYFCLESQSFFQDSRHTNEVAVAVGATYELETNGEAVL